MLGMGRSDMATNTYLCFHDLAVPCVMTDGDGAGSLDIHSVGSHSGDAERAVALHPAGPSQGLFLADPPCSKGLFLGRLHACAALLLFLLRVSPCKCCLLLLLQISVPASR